MKSKWADDEQDAADAAQRKRDKEEKKRAKAEKQRRAEEEQAQRQQVVDAHDRLENINGRPSKRRRLSHDGEADEAIPLLRFDTPGWAPSRSVTDYEILNPIEEGTYGLVSRARSKATGEIVALKKMKLEGQSSMGFPVTALREIQMLQRARHRNIVDIKEVVIDNSSNKKDVAYDAVYLVLEFGAHDLKSLIDAMPEPFLPSEVKTLMLQLTSALDFLHDNWIMHRDLKTSNILLTSSGRIKLADFGMARITSSPPPPNLTRLVVSLWYRGPEILLGATNYDFAVDMWSLGCVFGELLCKDTLLPGKNEVDQLARIFALVGIPSESSWPGYRRLPNAHTLRLPTRAPPTQDGESLRSILETKSPHLTAAGRQLIKDLLALNPDRRLTAKEVLEHHYFSEDPRPKAEELMPSFPSKAGMEKRRRRETPNAPARDQEAAKGTDFSKLFAESTETVSSARFQLRAA
ncbi:serine/threonine protein kinase, CMGC family, CDC2/CDK subfamily [Myriangium duriaei CBS 260.36]|uniref:cyclin-dependent kinase n=1 Tax=Myriangium duriaei CBS 260.36 TaxID=1168546 RepID=A0A9P4J293_9PEZI|nr:serine/threonine protein kinase, CMGC family, CDC2/CDK subfamily [Myriangium duriaei CBS 260.36]